MGKKVELFWKMEIVFIKKVNPGAHLGSLRP